jgi:hypothetical protein
MPDHYHLALETPEPTLGDGMHWLQSTLAARFSRFRPENGPLFRDRYKSLLVEDTTALARVVDYIHLNPLRSGIVPPEQLKAYRWSSLRAFMRGPRDPAMRSADWLGARGGWRDDPEGWTAYEQYLIAIGQDEARWDRDGLTGLSKGWAIGTEAWRKALAQAPAQETLAHGPDRKDARKLRETAWQESLNTALAEAGRSSKDLETKPKKTAWKIALAERIRGESGASVIWLARHLKIGQPSSLRGYLSISRNRIQPQASARPR